jgi:hypothetical protein
MPESQVRRDVVGTRREGRRSLSAYNAQARGVRVLVGSDRSVRPAQQRRRGEGDGNIVEAFNAGIALALVYPLVRRSHRVARPLLPHANGNEGTGMKRKPSIQSLESLSLDEAIAYLDHAGGDELSAAYALALDRARLDGSHAAPDDAEVHHALFLSCRARGKLAPSFDEMRVELRRRVAAA